MFRTERRIGIERKILTTILWVGIIPITVALIAGYIITHEGQRKAVEHTLATAAEKTSSGLLLALNARLRTIRTLSRDPEVIAAVAPGTELSAEDRETLIKRLKTEATSSNEEYLVYSLFDKTGRLVITTGSPDEEDAFKSDWLGSDSEVRFVEFNQDRPTGRNSARALAPVYSPKTNERIGFLSEDQGVRRLLEFALGGTPSRSDRGMGRDVYQVAYVGRRGGVLISYLDDQTPPRLQVDGADPELAAAIILPEPKSTGALRIRNYLTRGATEDVLLAFQRFIGPEESYQVYAVVYRPAADVFQGINLWAFYSMVGTVLVIGVFLLVAYRSVHNNIVRPLSLLNEGAHNIRQGDLHLKLKINTGDEIEELSNSFNKMALALNQNVRQLEESEEKYRSLVTSMRDGIYQTDPEGVITFLNPAGAEIFGHEQFEDAIGRNLRELFLEEIDFARITADLERQAFVERTRIWMKRTDGRAICVELSANRVLDDEGLLAGIEGIFRDVTTTVRYEQQARERSERIAAINQIANVINSSLEAGRLHESLIVELKKLVNFDYASVALLNEKAETALRDEALPRPDTFEKRQLWPEQLPTRPLTEGSAVAAWVAIHRRSLNLDDLDAQGPEFADEFPETTRSCLCVPLYATGRIVGTLNLGAARSAAFSKHDIEVLEEMSPHIAVAMRNARLLENLQQSLEEVTRAREKLHEANEELKTLDEMKTNLLSNVSHELRTPLVSVMGYTDMILNRKVGAINEVQGEYLSIIMRNVEKLVTLIENLLDFSRLYRGTEKLVFDQFDLVDCARTSIQTIQPVADSRSIAIELVVSDPKILIEGDKGRMGQVFNNLLSNGVKFNNPGGSITIQIQRREDSVEVSATDTGIGIPPEALDKVFTRFYQYDSSSTRKYGGTGIGLSIAQDIVRLHGSRITVTSEVEKGTVFRFALPLTVAQPGETEETGSEPPIPTQTHLLVELVTQDRGLSLQLRDLLAPEGMEVVHAAQTTYATELIRRYNPDTLLVDMDSFDASEFRDNGKNILDTLLGDPLVAPLPIVMLTNDDDLYERYRYRVAARVKHGFRKSSLLSAIHYAITQNLAAAKPLGNKILCVDDDPEVLIFVGRCLESEGYSVDSCLTGQEGLDRLATHDYGIVLLDIAMPGIDGWETCRTIKASPTLAGVKVYFVTAKPVDRSTGRMQEVGADGYLLKPFKPEDLIALIRGTIPTPAPTST